MFLLCDVYLAVVTKARLPLACRSSLCVVICHSSTWFL